MLTAEDEAVRGALTRLIAELGHAPSSELLAERVGRGKAEVELSLQRLADSHALLLHPGSLRPWAVHPFALAPGSCWVRTPDRGYWANCLYCGLGIAAALGSDARVTTRLGGERETAVYRVEGGKLLHTQGVFHLSTPAAQWWDNVIFACATFQPFASEADVDPWCARHALPRGHVMSLDALWAFASDWYGSYLRAPWRKRTASQVRTLFDRHGLTGPFWSW